MKALEFKTILLVVACYLIVFSAGILHINLINKAQSQELTTDSNDNSIPAALSIPNIQLEVLIEDGQYDQESDSWNISDSFAYYAKESQPLSSKLGNTVIYAHNKNHLFGNLRDLSPGDTAEIIDANGFSYQFTYQTNIETSPKDTSVFYSDDFHQLVLITCSGFFDQYRSLYFFSAINK